MSNPAVIDATLQLLIRVNHLLSVADEVRTLRDRMIDATKTTAPHATTDAPADTPREVAGAR